MKLVSYLKNGAEQLAVLADGYYYDMDALNPRLPETMNEFLNHWDRHLPRAAIAAEALQSLRVEKIDPAAVRLMAPVPFPGSCRDGYAFRQHVAAARKNRGLEMITEFDQYPVFYFTNHRTIQGPGEIICMPDHLDKLDFELEAAVVICREGKNIKAHMADSYIAGLMIMNDMSARTLQYQEMLLNLGPAKGKDFATAVGPWLVTLDELEQFVVAAKPGHIGKAWNLTMKCWVNGQQVSMGNLADMDWTFAEIIERASYGVTLYPGDIIGSGTVGTGCFLELNGTAKLNNPAYKEQWLQPGDLVEMEIDQLGKLANRIVTEDSGYSILSMKKI